MAKGYSARKGFSGGAGMMQQQAQMQQKLMKISAVNEALRQAEEAMSSSMNALTGGLNIPGLGL